jgi:type VI secretion system protein ImpC
LTLVAPRVLLRLPYAQQRREEASFVFTEAPADESHRAKYLWGTAVWPLGARITNAWALFEWPAAISGEEGGGLVEHLAGVTTNNLGWPALSTDLIVSERIEAMFYQAGCSTLKQMQRSGDPVFSRVWTCHLPGGWSNEEANKSDSYASQLPYVLAGCRFAQLLRRLARDTEGVVAREELENRLNRWISNHILLDDAASMEMKARFPLRSGRVTVASVDGEPSRAVAVLFVLPHFQLEGLLVPMRFVVPLQIAD